MPNKWVQFVKKWSAENNMNYMCAMTTKECKEAYLKEHPKPEKKARPYKSKYGLNKSDDVDLLLNEISDMEFGSPFLNDIAVENKIREIAKKHKIDISKFGEDEDGSMVENVLEGVRYGKSKKVSAFFEDFYDLIQSVKERAEGREMGKEDVPAPAPPAPPAKKVKVVVRKKKAVVPPAPDRTEVQMELVKMGQKAKDVAEKRANIQMELSEIGKKAKLKEAQKEAQKYLSTKGMANKAKQMAVEKEQVREEAKQVREEAKEKEVASKKRDLIAELRKMIENEKVYLIGQAKTKDAIQSLSKKQGFGFSGGVYNTKGGRGYALNGSDEMIENALTVLDKGKIYYDDPRHTAFLTELVDFVKSNLDELKAKETAKAVKDTAKAEKAKTKAEKAKAKADALALARFQEAETNPALKVLTNADLLKLIGSFGRLDIKGADKKLNELWEEVYDLAIDDEIGEYLDDIGWKTGYKLEEILGDVFGSKKEWKKYFEKAPDDWEGDEGKGELLVRNFAGTDSIQNIQESLFTDKEGVNGTMMKLEPAKLFIKLNELVSEWLKNVKENETPEAKKRQEKKRKEDIKKWKTLTYPRPYDDTFTIWGLTKDGDQLIVYEDLSDPRSIIWHKTGEPISFRKDDYWNDAEAKYASKVGINKYKKAYRWDMTKAQLEKLTRDTFL